MASEVLLPDEVISHFDWLTIGGDPGDFLGVVADDFGGVGTYIESDSPSAAIEYGFGAPAGGATIARIDVRAEARWNDGSSDLEVDLWIDGAWQGVQAMELTGTWQVYTFGGWTGSWTPPQVAASKLKLQAAVPGKGDTISVATLRQVVTAQSAGGRMLLVGVGP